MQAPVRFFPTRTLDKSRSLGIMEQQEMAHTEAQPMADSDAQRTRPDNPNQSSGAGDDSTDFLEPPQRPNSLGRLGHYEILQLIGRGGFGIVFRAFDDVLQREVAIKVMSPRLASNASARKRFVREARGYAAVRHENVVQVHAIEADPVPYLVMEYIPGQSLADYLSDSGPLPPPMLHVLAFKRPKAWLPHTRRASFTATSNRRTCSSSMAPSSG
jgi:serine/threonine protein kinase